MNVMLQSDTRFFKDRESAGLELAERLVKYSSENPMVLALPRGGVPVGYEVACALHAPLEVIVTRKIGLSGNKEFGVGAIGEGGVTVLNKQLLSLIGLSKKDVQEIIDEETTELNRRIKLYRQNQPLPVLKGKTVILVDDGLATGVTAKAAIEVAKKQKPKKIIFAAPVCAFDTIQDVGSLVDEMVCVSMPLEFRAVANWYQYFPQLSDQEVVELLTKSKQKESEMPFFPRGY